ncbi:FAD-binding protein [Agarivorans sp. QJM3NY_25]|uniref:FAD-binding oxidoreductase n=1 Tax=Agarivorans sp. QJM3NY_25 TaxID=3421430 RepID=UPI003D7ECAFE
MSEFQSWGQVPYAEQHVSPFLWRHHNPYPEVDAQTNILPYGNGRSYGDSCLNHTGSLLNIRPLKRLLSFDRVQGRLTCEAGVLLSEVLACIVPHGWFLPVTPGTQFVTVGGAIANDVHGKNHHVDGTFGVHVECFELLRSNGERLLCSLQQNSELFRATIGGLGLTGVITWVEFRLKAIGSNMIDSENVKCRNLDEFFSLAEDSDQQYDYTVAWIDCLASGASLGRGIFMRGNHASQGVKSAPRLSLSVPLTPPISLINKLSLKAFNFAYYHKQMEKVHQQRTHYQPFFYPLDAVGEWNRIYGPKGFYQYQCVIPLADAKAGMKAILTEISASGSGSFLAVLKMFGAVASPGLLSFPQEGVTLALDFPNQGDKTRQLMQKLDDITFNHGGRVYPAKDARMSAEHFQHYYPQWRQLEALRDPRHSSSFWRRVTEL